MLQTWKKPKHGIYFEESFYVGFEINGCELGLDPDMDQVNEGNSTVSYWSVDDINAAVDKAISIGAEIFSPITNIGGTIKVAIVKGPFGNHIGFISE